MALEILLFAVIGFIAQLIDGALGMAYGVSATTFLLTLGVPPAAASASVHTAETFTTAISGLSHLRLGNINKSLVLTLAIPGVIGGVVGAYVLTSIPTEIVKPVIAIYLFVMGLVILVRAFKGVQPRENTPYPVLLALVGGFFDAIGGGGWGPIVTTTLVARGHEPRTMIGSVNLTEFFVTTAQAITFFAVIGSALLENWRPIVGLLLGGAIAAPLAAFATRRMPAKTLMFLLGVLIILLSLRTLYLALVPAA